MQSSFPLLSASVASYRTSISDPIRYLQSQAHDLLTSMGQISHVPTIEQALAKVGRWV